MRVMTAPVSPLSRAQLQALSAPLLIEDQEVVCMLARLADERGTQVQETIRLAVEAYLRRHELTTKAPAWAELFWKDHELPLPTGLLADKRFYDSLNDEL